MATSLQYLGTSVAYPLTISKGKAVIYAGTDVIKGSLLMLLMTPIGSRYFLPEYGTLIHELLFEPNDEVLARLLRIYIKDAIVKWEKRIELTAVSIIMGADGALCITLYRVLGSNEVDSFVFPFYKNKSLAV